MNTVQPSVPTRARVLLVYAVLSLLISYALVSLVWPSWSDAEPRPPLPVVVHGSVWYCLLLLLLLRRAGQTRGSLAALIERRPDRSAVARAAITSLALIGISYASIYGVFLPLSYVAPDAVQSWLLDAPAVASQTGGSSAWVLSALELVSAVALAPATEELLFRGLLLPAWSARWGSRRAVIVSSAIFALLHADVLGSFVFSLVVSRAFLSTRSLWVPWVIHATGNAFAWMIVIGSTALTNSSTTNVTEFQSSWWVGLVGLLGVPLLIAVLPQREASPPAPAP